MGNPLKGVVDKLDGYQRGHPWLGFPFGVVKKFGDDEAGKQAALIAYYGFFSLFPLMLVFVTVLGFVLGNNSHLKDEVVHSVISRFPVIGDQIKFGSLKGSGLALAVGIVGALWGGLGVVRAAQGAMDTVWHVPRKKRPSFIKSRTRALLLLLVLGAGLIISVLLTGLATAGTGHSMWTKVLALVISTLINFGVFLAAMMLLTVANVSWRQLLPGAVIAALAGLALQALGGYIVGHTFKSASQTYGTLGVVIALLSWIYLQAQVFLFAAEVNTVRAMHLWPRGLDADRPTEADRRVLTGLAEMEERRTDEDIDVRFQRVS
ncbi:MAG TPA: YihY/virulence factor BrkB family protein [Acidimicrobiales bacterium]|jgi:YihY family inner membrane protein|nr:YihY/virulence factor BrkB family protein [Acidimicrobiales bacterium]